MSNKSPEHISSTLSQVLTNGVYFKCVINFKVSNKYLFKCMCWKIPSFDNRQVVYHASKCHNVRGMGTDLENTLQWRHNGHDGVSNHQPHHCLHNRLFRHRWKKTSKLRVIGLCVGNSPGTGEFPAQMASNAENASIWWRHHDLGKIS